jgi:23S rRNA (adenine2030-N6)-methyltransferase
VLKHIVVVEILEHLSKKDKAFEYIDSHAGAGLYSLQSEHAVKLQEYTNGIGKLKAEDWPELARYFEIISVFNKSGTLDYYPGSPMFAKHYLRGQDKAWCFELHPADFDLLELNLGSSTRIRLKQEDGFKGMLALLPPLSRRGLILIDPSYEMKTDYRQVFDSVALAHKKFSTGIYAIWYPVVDRHRIIQLQKKFIASGIKNIQCFELGVTADSDGRGMTAAGMMVINPPWMLRQKMSQLLPRLVTVLGEDATAFSRCDVLVSE